MWYLRVYRRGIGVDADSDSPLVTRRWRVDDGGVLWQPIAVGEDALLRGGVESQVLGVSGMGPEEPGVIGLRLVVRRR